MTKLVLIMTMSLDGFFSGPEGELDWMTQAPDPEFSHDNVSSFDRFDRGFIGYPTASGMLPYWLSVASNPQTPADQRALVALGTGKRVFTGKDDLELIDAKTYRSGVIRARYRPAR
jgi:hypothetical protein